MYRLNVSSAVFSEVFTYVGRYVQELCKETEVGVLSEHSVHQRIPDQE